MEENLKEMLGRQSYGIVGSHGAVKICHWLKRKLLKGEACYKERFYGIECHRCLQMTPTVDACTQSCLFCWRYQGFTRPNMGDAMDPEDMLEGAIEAQRRLLTGYKGNPVVPRKMWEEAQEPNQMAISLSGEPTMYPHLGGLIEAAKKRGMTTFLVTNGTNPHALEELDPLPTQLYVTIAAPNKEIYGRLCLPTIEGAWERIQATLEILPSLDTRRAIRHTLVEGWNIGWESEYARMDEMAEPHFVEPKGYVFVGYSRERLTWDQMPAYERVRAFSRKLGEELGMEIVGEQPGSRVAVLARDSKTLKINL